MPPLACGGHRRGSGSGKPQNRGQGCCPDTRGHAERPATAGRARRQTRPARTARVGPAAPQQMMHGDWTQPRARNRIGPPLVPIRAQNPDPRVGDRHQRVGSAAGASGSTWASARCTIAGNRCAHRAGRQSHRCRLARGPRIVREFLGNSLHATIQLPSIAFWRGEDRSCRGGHGWSGGRGGASALATTSPSTSKPLVRAAERGSGPRRLPVRHGTEHADPAGGVPGPVPQDRAQPRGIGGPARGRPSIRLPPEALTTARHRHCRGRCRGVRERHAGGLRRGYRV